MKFKDSAIVELFVSLIVLMAMFAGMKLAMSKLPDNGIVGDVKHFFQLA